MLGTKKPEMESNGKICPFCFNPGGLAITSVAEELGKCLADKCMLWNPAINDCNLNVIASKL